MFATSELSFGGVLLFLGEEIKDLKAADRDVIRDFQNGEQQIARLYAAVEANRCERDRPL